MARIDLDTREIEWLDGLPELAHQTPQSVSCRLDLDHDGPHVGLGQTSGEDDYWVRWTLRASEMVSLPACPERDTANDEQCLLFERHPGRCTFER